MVRRSAEKLRESLQAPEMFVPACQSRAPSRIGTRLGALRPAMEIRHCPKLVVPTDPPTKAPRSPRPPRVFPRLRGLSIEPNRLDSAIFSCDKRANPIPRGPTRPRQTRAIGL